MAWAQNLLGFCLFACAPQTPFSWVWPGGLQSSKSYVAQRWGNLSQPFFFVFSRFQEQRFGIFLVSAFFRLRFRNGLGTKPAGVLLFRMRVLNTFFLSLAWWLAGCFFVFSRFQKQRFGSFLAAVSHGLGTFFLMGSKSDVSAFFRLRFRNGLGTKPAGVLLFRMRVPNTFFLSLAWWLVGFQVLRCAKVCLAWGNLFSLFLVVSKSNVSAFFWLRFRMARALFLCFFFVFSGFQKRRFGIFPAAVSQWLGHKTCWGSAFSHARPKHLFLEFGLVACRLPSLTLRCALLEATFRNLFSLFLVGSKSNVEVLSYGQQSGCYLMVSRACRQKRLSCPRLTWHNGGLS